MFGQEIRRWCITRDTAGWRDMVSGDGITKQCQYPRPFNIAGRLRDLTGHAFKIRWVLHIGGAIIPIIGHPAGCLNGLPFRRAVEYISIA